MQCVHEEIFFLPRQNALRRGDIGAMVAQDGPTHWWRWAHRLHYLLEFCICARKSVILSWFFALVASLEILSRSRIETLLTHIFATCPSFLLSQTVMLLWMRPIWIAPLRASVAEGILVSVTGNIFSIYSFTLINLWLPIAQPVDKVFVLFDCRSTALL